MEEDRYCFVIPLETEGGPAHPKKGLTATDSWWVKEFLPEELESHGIRDNSDKYFQLQQHKAVYHGEAWLGWIGKSIGSGMQKIWRWGKGQRNVDEYRVVWALGQPWWCLASSESKDSVLRSYAWLMENVQPLLASLPDDLARERLTIKMVVEEVSKTFDLSMLPFLLELQKLSDRVAIMDLANDVNVVNDSQKFQLCKHQLIHVIADSIRDVPRLVDLEQLESDLRTEFGDHEQGDLSIFDMCFASLLLQKRAELQLQEDDLRAMIVDRDEIIADLRLQVASLAAQVEQAKYASSLKSPSKGRALPPPPPQMSTVTPPSGKVVSEPQESKAEAAPTIPLPPPPPPPPPPPLLNVQKVSLIPKKANRQPVQTLVSRPDILASLAASVLLRRRAIQGDDDHQESSNSFED